MKSFWVVWCLLAAFAAQAVPAVSGVSFYRRSNGVLRFKYVLSNDPAVVTVALSSPSGHIDESTYTNLTGDVNCLVQPGVRRFDLRLGPEWEALGLSDGDIRVNVRAWMISSPPDYMVMSLTNSQEKVAYYVSTNAFPVQFASERHKTTHLVMKRVHAANVEFRMGSPENESLRQSNEALRWAILSKDYYIGIYPVTKRQHDLAVGFVSSDSFWGDARFSGVRRDDWPVCRISFSMLRSYPHGLGNGEGNLCGGPGSPGYQHIPAWPADGHEMYLTNRVRCACQSNGSWFPYMASWRSRYGFEFDLPTEAQWEFACRGGLQTRDYFATTVANYAETSQWCRDLDAAAWTVRNSTNETLQLPVVHSVGLKPANPFGLYDMIGLVGEWCLDLYELPAASTTPVRDPIGKSGFAGVHFSRNDKPVLKGGSWLSDLKHARPAARSSLNPAYANTLYDAVAAQTDNLSSWLVGYRLCLPCQAVR